MSSNDIHSVLKEIVRDHVVSTIKNSDLDDNLRQATQRKNDSANQLDRLVEGCKQYSLELETLLMKRKRHASDLDKKISCTEEAAKVRSVTETKKIIELRQDIQHVFDANQVHSGVYQQLVDLPRLRLDYLFAISERKRSKDELDVNALKAREAQDKLTEAQLLSTQCTDKNTAISSQIETIKAVYNAKQAELESLKNQQSRDESTLANLVASVAQLENTLKEEEQALNEAKLLWDDHVSKNGIASHLQSSSNNVAEALSLRLKELESQLALREEELKKHNENIAVIKEQAHKVNSELSKCESHNVSLLASLTSLRDEHDAKISIKHNQFTKSGVISQLSSAIRDTEVKKREVSRHVREMYAEVNKKIAERRSEMVVYQHTLNELTHDYNQYVSDALKQQSKYDERKHEKMMALKTLDEMVVEAEREISECKEELDLQIESNTTKAQGEEKHLEVLRKRLEKLVSEESKLDTKLEGCRVKSVESAKRVETVEKFIATLKTESELNNIFKQDSLAKKEELDALTRQYRQIKELNRTVGIDISKKGASRNRTALGKTMLTITEAIQTAA